MARIMPRVPEVKHRYGLMNRLAKIHNSPGGSGGGMPVGLSTAEIEWQISMAEKYGSHHASWPDNEKQAHLAQQAKGGTIASKSEQKPLSGKLKKLRK